MTFTLLRQAVTEIKCQRENTIYGEKLRAGDRNGSKYAQNAMKIIPNHFCPFQVSFSSHASLAFRMPTLDLRLFSIQFVPCRAQYSYIANDMINSNLKNAPTIFQCYLDAFSMLHSEPGVKFFLHVHVIDAHAVRYTHTHTVSWCGFILMDER